MAWPYTTEDVVFRAQFVLALLFLGAGAWQGRLDRQPGIAELSRTLGTGRAEPMALGWLALTFWGIVAYGGAVGPTLLLLSHKATWGHPDLQPILGGAAIIIGATGIGYALGFALPTFVLIPVWMATWWFFDGLLPMSQASVTWLAPRSMSENVDRSLFRETVPANIDLKQAAWFVSIAFFFVLVCMLSVNRTWRLSVASLALGAVALFATMSLLAVSGQIDYGTGALRAFTPVCKSEGAVTVCVHPAQRDFLNPALASLAPALAPLAGLDGIQQTIYAMPVADDQALYLGDMNSLTYVTWNYALDGLLPEMLTSGDEPTYAQAVIATWLYQVTGNNLLGSPFAGILAEPGASQTDLNHPVVPNLDAVDRFSSLSTDEQHAWFVANLDALRNGTLDAAVLP